MRDASSTWDAARIAQRRPTRKTAFARPVGTPVAGGNACKACGFHQCGCATELNYVNAGRACLGGLVVEGLSGTCVAGVRYRYAFAESEFQYDIGGGWHKAINFPLYDNHKHVRDALRFRVVRS